MLMNGYGMAGDPLYPELWRACAGPLAAVPRVGDLVFYLPQGHIEQVEESTLLPIDISMFQMPSKLLCRVHNVELKAEMGTDVVYAQIMLRPEKNQDAAEKPSRGFAAAATPSPAVRSFCKTLNSSETSSRSVLSVGRRHANECFPPLDMSQSHPTQELVAKDLHGMEWRFRHIFRERPRRRHFLQSGWNVFVSSKRLVAGDTFVFLRGENGELRVGIKRAMAHLSNIQTPTIISTQSMHLGILAAARHALVSNLVFAVHYKPSVSTSGFIIQYDQYMESVNKKYSVGMRFSMKFEGENASVQRFTGTIVGCENIDPVWPDSSWRHCKVQWDEPSTIPRPDRVSPWNIEPASSTPVNSFSLSRGVKIHRKNTPPISLESSLLAKEAATRIDTDYSAANWWRPPRPRMVAYATSSSTSGSISTSYTSGSSQLQSSDQGGSPPPVTLSTRPVEEIASKLEHVQFPWLELEEEKEKTSGHIKSLVQEFCTTSNSALVLERWFSDLGVSWVLSISEDFPRELQHFARSWIAALAVIQVFIFTYLDGSHNQGDGKLSPSASEFARFLQSTFSKMLPFVDAIVAPNAIIDSASVEQTMSRNGEATEPTEEKLQPLLGVHDALSAASEQIQLWPHCPSFVGSEGMIDEVSKLLSAKLGKLDEVVWDTVDEIRTSITSFTKADPTDIIHLATRSITHCIKVLSTNYRLANQIVSKAASLGKYVPDQAGKISPLVNTGGDAFAILIMEMLSCLQEKLSQLSKSFPDQSLRFLFLLNNTYFMWQQLHPNSSLESHMPALTCKIDEHMQSYLQASWEPVMSCLRHPTPLCLGRYSPLAKFKLEFQKTSTAQMLWKVPDPELKRMLRKAIIDKVNSGFTKYMEDYNIITPKVTPQELEETLQQIFEG
ncbi:unnamed protein product [Urochloa humidicola]